MFESTKVIVSLYDNQIKGKLDSKVVDKLKFDEIQDKNLSILDDPTYENLYKISLALADGVIFASDIKNKYKDLLKKIKIPELECYSHDDFDKQYLDFYNKFLADES